MEHEIKTKPVAGMAKRGYADHSIPLPVSWATDRQIIARLDKYGNC